ncbi:SPRY domain-containing SOCS box protein 3 [Holothuria leucospilota]|uniref:SPRY domain-containing SOCS box protein 3 n=1 Tax=Holothuria leucospilota TaxID=206669 RepID=A0A9Q1H9D4_HOLLE|nr:SPRY domain-containing SOCS box protein 3 [Holothuria leucospilota]
MIGPSCSQERTNCWGTMKRKAEEENEGCKRLRPYDEDDDDDAQQPERTETLQPSHHCDSSSNHNSDASDSEKEELLSRQPCLCTTGTTALHGRLAHFQPIISELPLLPTSLETTDDLLGQKSSVDFDWVWDDQGKVKSCVQLSRNKAEVRFHSNYSLGTASARSSEPLTEGQNYWEIKMVSPVYGTDMMVGIGTKRVDLDKFINQFCSMLGTDSEKESCGLSYLGYFYHGGRKTKFCDRFGQGAVIGVHLDLWRGSLSYYKNGNYLGVACSGLKGREWYPMVSSTAAKSSMCLIRTASFESSLQYLCCQKLRESIPARFDVLSVVDMPPGLKKFLKNNLYWLLGAHINTEDVQRKSTGTQTSSSKTIQRRKQSSPFSVKSN